MLPQQTTPLTLLERLQQGNDEKDWKLFVAIYEPLIRKYLTSIHLPLSDIDDVVQECFAEVIAHLDGFQHNGRVGAFRRWLRMIVLRRAQRFASKRTDAPMTNECLNRIAGVDERFDEFWDAEHNRFVIEKLLAYIQSEFTKTTWLAFQMHVLQDMTADDTAKRLGCTKNVVAIAKSRVLRRLRQIGKGLIEW